MKTVRDSSCRSRAVLTPFLLMCGVVVAGCGGTETPAAVVADEVTARVELVDRVSTTLTIDTVMAVKGTYGTGCTARAGSWAIALNGYQLVAGETQLTVVLHDAGCSLSVTEVKAGAVATPQSFRPASPFQLAATFAGQGVAFLLNGAGATQFYANFRVQPDLAFNSDFVVQVAYSDNVSETDLSTDTTYAVVVATATAAPVPAPNASMSLSALSIKVDSHKVVTTATGSIALAQGSVIAEQYVVDFDTLGTSPSYASIDVVFTSPAKTRVALSGASQAIPASELALVGLDLSTPKIRNVIVANVENGVNSYELFQITVNKP